MPVYVPLKCGRTLLVPGVNDARLVDLQERLWLVAPEPRVDGDRIFSPWAHAETDEGRIVLAVRDLEAQRVGALPADQKWTVGAVSP